MRKYGKIFRRTIMIAVIIFLVLHWGNTSIQITRYEIKSSRIEEKLTGLCIVQISDLHNAMYGHKQEKLIRKVKAQKPDCIVITGDFIDSNHTDTHKAMDFIDGAVELAPVYYVTGNHEAWSRDSYEEIKKQMQEAGVHLMDGKAEKFMYGDETIQLIGIQDPSFDEGVLYTGTKQVVDTELEQLHYDRNRYTILLSHRPELFEEYVSHDIDLVFSGHAHGGQFRIPFIGGVIAPDQGLMPKYSAGVFQTNKTQMVVSRGLGNSMIPVRIFNRPELVVVKLSHTD